MLFYLFHFFELSLSDFCFSLQNPIWALTQLAQTTMRSELGKITLDKTFEERESLNYNIVKVRIPILTDPLPLTLFHF